MRRTARPLGDGGHGEGGDAPAFFCRRTTTIPPVLPPSSRADLASDTPPTLAGSSPRSTTTATGGTTTVLPKNLDSCRFLSTLAHSRQITPENKKPRKSLGNSRENWRREWDSNPRRLITSPDFESGAFDRSAISPQN